MNPAYIFNSTATNRDLAVAAVELIRNAETLHRLILLNCFDTEGIVTASSHELLSESLWIVAGMLHDAENMSAKVVDES